MMKLRLSASRPDLCAVFLLLGLVLPPAMAPLGTALAADMDKQTPSDSKAENPVPIDVGFWATSRARTDYEVVVVQYWSVGPLLRAEAVTRGQNIVTLVNGDYYYAYDALTNSGYRIRRTAGAIAADSGRKRPFGMHLQEILDQGGEKIREDTLGGIPVDVYRLTNDEERRTLWVQKESDAIPVRIETYDRRRGRTARLDWVNWLSGLKVPPSFFAPPVEVKFEEFDTYQDFLVRLAAGSVPPAPPFFQELIENRRP
jgi:hypothetical protein